MQQYAGYPSVTHLAAYKGIVQLNLPGVEYYIMYAKHKGVKMRKVVKESDAAAAVTLLRLKRKAHRHEEFFKQIGFLEPWDEQCFPSGYRAPLANFEFFLKRYAQVAARVPSADA